MTYRSRPLLILVALTLALLVPPVPGKAGDEEGALHRVRMLTDSPNGRFRFNPEIVEADEGDRVRFVASSDLHASTAIPGMLPREVEPWYGEIGEDVEIGLERPGVYGFKCAAHYALGMVGLIVVGDATAQLDRAQAVKHPPLASEAFEELFAELASH